MSPTPLFVVLGLLMTVLAAAWVGLPVLRSRAAAADGHAGAAPWGVPRLAALAIVLVVVPAVVLLSYPRTSNFDWSTLAGGAGGVAAGSRQAGLGDGDGADFVRNLAQRLQQEGGTPDEWRLLGRSFLQLQQYGGAEQAFREAYRQVSGAEPQLIAEVAGEYAEAMILADQRALITEAEPLLERVLELAPDSPRGLWWGGLAAFERGRYTIADERWSRLAGQPDMASQAQMAEVLQQRIVMARQLAAENAPPPSEIRQRMAEAQGQAQASPPATTPPAAGDGTGAETAAAALAVRVEIAPELQAQLDGDRTLFVIARTPGGGGPPLAVVRRRSSELPLAVTLSDADAMIPGRGISSADVVEVVARISASGNPIAAAGDLWGSEQVSVSGNDEVAVTISQVTR